MKIKKSIMIGLAVITMVGCSPQETTKKEESPTKVAQTQEPEVVIFDVLDADIALLSKAYSELSETEVKRLKEIEQGQNDIQDEGTKSEVIDNITRLREEKEAIEEEERLEAERKAEEERIAKEKKEEEERIAAEKEKAERYVNPPTWNDLARDKEGLKGEFVKFKGKVLQVMADEKISQYRLAVDSNYDQVILVGIANDKLEQNILDDDIITVEGMSLGITEYTTVMGASRTIPMMLAENVYTK